MRRLTAGVGLLLFALTAWGQCTCPWQSSGSNVVLTNGNVGIGTQTPSQSLEVAGPVRIGKGGQYNAIIQAVSDSNLYIQTGPSYQTRMVVDTLGNVGIGTTSPQRALDITNTAGGWNSVLSMFTDSSAQYSGTGLLIQGLNGNNARVNLGGFSAQVYSSAPGAEIGQVKIRSMANGTLTEALTILGGNVGIGTTSPPPQYKLSVKGSIGANEVVVLNTSGWSDYVFQPGYQLRPLGEIAGYIKEHRHLPNIPSEKEVQESGIGVGEMQAKLLAKIEELTLHVIRLDEQNRELRKEVRDLERSRHAEWGDRKQLR